MDMRGDLQIRKKKGEENIDERSTQKNREVERREKGRMENRCQRLGCDT